MAASALKGVLALVAGILALILSILGCCTIKYKHVCVTCPFVICSFLIGLMALIAGGMVMGGGARDKVIDDMCKYKFASFGNKNAKQIMKAEYMDIVDKVMCSSDLCPCDDGNAANKMSDVWKANPLATETRIAKFKRTWNAGSFDRSQANAVIPMYFTLKTGDKFSNYKTCYNKVLKTMDPNNNKIKNSAAFKKAQKEFNKGGWKFLSDLEAKGNCAGICSKPLFFMTKDLSAGPPTMDCIESFTQAFGGNIALGLVAFVTAATLICVGICALPLCTDYNKNTEEEE